MRRLHRFALAAVALPGVVLAQGADESSKAVAGGGITLAGWEGKVDAREATAGLKITDAKLAAMGPGFHVTTGPATTYWNTKEKLTGDYTVMATFNEAKYMSINDHAHPYGIVIAAKGFDTDKPEALYCAAYGNGNFIFRGFSSTAPRGTFSMTTGRAGDPNPAVNKAAGKDQPVKQAISVSVKGDNVTCSINGTVVGTYTKASLIGDGKVTSLDGYAGVRFGHNTDAHVSGWMVMK